MRAPLPPDEAERLAALSAYGQFGTEPEEGFDRITRLVARTLGVPVALVSLVGEDRQWLKSCLGLPGVRETSRDVAFCAHAILTDEPLVVPDATLDPRFRDNPLVTDWPGIRFYAGVPLRMPDGSRLGSLCAIDSVPRGVSAAELTLLQDLAAMAVDELELRRALRESESQKRLLASEEERYRLLAESTQGLMFQAVQREPLRFDFEYASPGCQNLLGISPEAFVADRQTFLGLFHPDDAPGAFRAIETSLRTSGPFDWEGRFLLAGGAEKWVRILAHSLVRSDGIVDWRGVVLDVTEAKGREEALAKAKEEAERATRAKGEFVSRVSHELRTPLNAILGFAQILETEPLEEEALEDVREIRKAGTHLLGLINEILDISRADARVGAEAPVPLCEVLKETYGLLRPAMDEKGVRLRAAHLCGDAHVAADRAKLKQAFINLIGNAIKYNRSGGSVRVRTRLAERGRVTISVKDEGPGIPEHLVDRLFVPFDRLGAETTGVEGTGLGLTIVKRFMDSIGGEIEVTSVPGEGATFVLRLPVAKIWDDARQEARAA